MACPSEGDRFYGQDAQYTPTAPSYEINSDQTVVTNLNTGLRWEKAHHSTSVNYSDAWSYCDNLSLGGYTDWRLPDVKEAFSISDFRGRAGSTFYIDSAYFDMAIPTEGTLTGSHTYSMMGQTWTSTVRPDNSNLVYFINFLDGHIKSQSKTDPSVLFFYRCVSGAPGGFTNSFQDNGDDTVTDNATGLIWQKANGEQGANDYQFNWEEALSYCENLSLAGQADWKLPDVKELQSIVDYTRIDPALDTGVFTFNKTPGTSSFFWSSTTHGDNTAFAAYVCFGPCDSVSGADIHGPGAQRSDPKLDDGTNYSSGIGDQRDVVQINNYVRCLRGNV